MGSSPTMPRRKPTRPKRKSTKPEVAALEERIRSATRVLETMKRFQDDPTFLRSSLADLESALAGKLRVFDEGETATDLRVPKLDDDEK